MFNKDLLDLFFYTADERQRIFLKKSSGLDQSQWTNDPIFKEWRFCNVYRRQDKVTKYMIDNFITPLDGCNEEEAYYKLYKGVFIGRFFSRIDTLDFLMNQFDVYDTSSYPLIIKALMERNKKHPLTTNAFILKPLTIEGKQYKKLNTPFYLIKLLIAHDFFKVLKKRPPIEFLVNYFIDLLPCTAGFMAYEYATDLTYSKLVYPNKPADYYTYANFTRGSLSGLNRLLGKGGVKDKVPDLKALTIELLQIWNTHVKKTGVLTLDENNSLSMREVEHWLCEFDKYMRLKNKETNRLKKKYIRG